MDSLETNWLPYHHKYPIYLLTQDKRWSREDKVAIKRKWNHFDIHFMSIYDQFWNYPKNVTFEDAKKAPLSNIEYKNMIAFMTYGFTRIPELTQYHYLMRLDDDACIKDAINYDMFAEMRSRRSMYAFHDMFIDPAHVVVGINEFMDDYADQAMQSNHNNHIGSTAHLRRDKTTQWANLDLHNWRINLHMKDSPAFADNFEIIDIRRYMENDIAQFLRHVENSHMIYHRRWGDSPIRYYMAELFWGPQEVLWLCDFDFQHSSWKLSYMCDHRISNNSVIKFWEWQGGPHPDR
jgi:hypothetical protein